MTDHALDGLPATGEAIEDIPVHVSYEIIRLFSEGLYQSPHKAVEELVSNGYDAGASAVHVVLPEQPDGDGTLHPLWVIDDGQGMDSPGFRQLWRVADSSKTAAPPDGGRSPIGQFGIGKLAAYVLAWRLTHISRSGGVIRATSINFRDLTGMHQYEPQSPLPISLRKLTEAQAKDLLSELETRDNAAWQRLFGSNRSTTWTVAALSDFKNLYDKLSAGRLGWVLSTGLPLHATFQIWLNGVQLTSSKEAGETITEVVVGSDADTASQRLGIQGGDRIRIDGIEGEITGSARIFTKRLTEGKSDQYERSHGFFVRVRGRVINLEDELFGLDALNHAAWSRFAMEIDADGLREHLLSSREGVRESEPIRVLRKYLHDAFNICRSAYDNQVEKDLAGIDLEQLLSDAPTLFVTEPLLEGVRRTMERGDESFYVTEPQLEEDVDPDQWLEEFATKIAGNPFHRVEFAKTGPYDRALRYIPETGTLLVNEEHPFIDKLVSMGRSRGAATLFGSSEVLMDVLLQDHGVPQAVVLELLKDRDRVLRVLAGDQPSTAREVLRRLRLAKQSDKALERAVGMAFRVLGFEFEKRGGYDEGPDGVLYARLGRGDADALADYKVVYDSKQTDEPSVPADKIDIQSLEDFRSSEGAQFSFFIAKAYAAESNPDGKLNRKVSQSAGSAPVTLLRLSDLTRIIELHYQYGVTLTRLRTLFEKAHTVPEVQVWMQELENELTSLEPTVPLRRLLTGIEAAKTDAKARPNINSVRAVDVELKQFSPEKLNAALKAVETIVGQRWLEVEPSGNVRIHGTAEQILAEVNRNLQDMFGVNALDHPEAK